MFWSMSGKGPWRRDRRTLRQMEDQLEMVLTKQLQEEDRQLQSIRECQFLLSRPVHEDVGEKHIVEIYKFRL